MERFLSKLQGQNMKMEEDRVVLNEDNKGAFSVRRFYSLLETNYSTPFPLKIIWNSWIPVKVSLFTWKAYYGKVLTLDQL